VFLRENKDNVLISISSFLYLKDFLENIFLALVFKVKI